MYSNHNGEKYIQYAQDLKSKLIEALPALNQPACLVLVNEFHATPLSKSNHDQEIQSRAIRGRITNNIWSLYPTQRYGFEVYFMGVRIYSKIKSKLWPNISMLSQKCVNAWNDFHDGKGISEYEHVTVDSSYNKSSVSSVMTPITSSQIKMAQTHQSVRSQGNNKFVWGGIFSQK